MASAINAANIGWSSRMIRTTISSVGGVGRPELASRLPPASLAGFSAVLAVTPACSDPTI